MEFPIILRKNEYLFESNIMKIEIKKLQVNQENIEAYFTSTSVIRNTTRRSSLNYGRIAIMTDADVDG